MRIESPRYTERFGSVRINDVQKVRLPSDRLLNQEFLRRRQE